MVAIYLYVWLRRVTRDKYASSEYEVQNADRGGGFGNWNKPTGYSYVCPGTHKKIRSNVAYPVLWSYLVDKTQAENVELDEDDVIEAVSTIAGKVAARNESLIKQLCISLLIIHRPNIDDLVNYLQTTYDQHNIIRILTSQDPKTISQFTQTLATYYQLPYIDDHILYVMTTRSEELHDIAGLMKIAYTDALQSAVRLLLDPIHRTFMIERILAPSVKKIPILSEYLDSATKLHCHLEIYFWILHERVFMKCGMEGEKFTSNIVNMRYESKGRVEGMILGHAYAIPPPVAFRSVDLGTQLCGLEHLGHVFMFITCTRLTQLLSIGSLRVDAYTHGNLKYIGPLDDKDIIDNQRGNIGPSNDSECFTITGVPNMIKNSNVYINVGTLMCDEKTKILAYTLWLQATHKLHEKISQFEWDLQLDFHTGYSPVDDEKLDIMLEQGYEQWRASWLTPEGIWKKISDGGKNGPSLLGMYMCEPLNQINIPLKTVNDTQHVITALKGTMLIALTGLKAMLTQHSQLTPLNNEQYAQLDAEVSEIDDLALDRNLLSMLFLTVQYRYAVEAYERSQQSDESLADAARTYAHALSGVINNIRSMRLADATRTIPVLNSIEDSLRGIIPSTLTVPYRFTASSDATLQRERSSTKYFFGPELVIPKGPTEITHKYDSSISVSLNSKLLDDITAVRSYISNMLDNT